MSISHYLKVYCHLCRQGCTYTIVPTGLLILVNHSVICADIHKQTYPFVLTQFMSTCVYMLTHERIWGVSRQLSQRGERQIVLYIAHVYDTKTNLKKYYDKHFRRIFSSAFQWCRQFSRNFPFSPSKSTKRVIS